MKWKLYYMILHIKQATALSSDFTLEDLATLNIFFDAPNVQQVNSLAIQDDLHLRSLSQIKEGLDIHTMTLCELPNSPETFIVSEARDVTKIILEEFLV
jgi:hypothetical protein